MSEKDMGVFLTAYDYYNNEEVDKAIAIVRVLSGRYYDNEYVLLLYGKCNYFVKDYPAALGYFEEAFKINSFFPETKIWLGKTLIAMGKEKKRAEALLKEVLVYDESNIEALYILVKYFHDSGQYDKALYYSNNFNYFEETMVNLYIEHAAIDLETGNVRPGVALLEKAQALTDDVGVLKKIEFLMGSQKGNSADE